MDSIERAFVLDALKRNDWNISKAAEEVGMLRPNFHALLKKQGISRLEIAECVFSPRKSSINPKSGGQHGPANLSGWLNPLPVSLLYILVGGVWIFATFLLLPNGFPIRRSLKRWELPSPSPACC